MSESQPRESLLNSVRFSGAVVQNGGLSESTQFFIPVSSLTGPGRVKHLKGQGGGWSGNLPFSKNSKSASVISFGGVRGGGRARSENR